MLWGFFFFLQFWKFGSGQWISPGRIVRREYSYIHKGTEVMCDDWEYTSYSSSYINSFFIGWAVSVCHTRLILILLPRLHILYLSYAVLVFVQLYTAHILFIMYIFIYLILSAVYSKCHTLKPELPVITANAHTVKYPSIFLHPSWPTMVFWYVYVCMYVCICTYIIIFLSFKSIFHLSSLSPSVAFLLMSFKLICTHFINNYWK